MLRRAQTHQFLIGLGMLLLFGPSAASQAIHPPAILAINVGEHQQARLDEALARFENAGLQLPDLTVRFVATTDACQGHHGLFSPRATGLTVTYCADPPDWVYEHELAHAWVHANTGPDRQVEFLEVRGLAAWNEPGAGWGEQGVEQAAFVVQQGVMGPDSVTGSEHIARLCTYEILVGQPPAWFDVARCDGGSIASP